MAQTTISDLWTPGIWIQATREKMAAFPSLMNSGAVAKSAQFDALATGPGTTVNLPTWKDTTDQSDGIQVEDTAPTPNEITTGTQIAPVLNRVYAAQATALAAAVSGGDPVGEITAQMAQRRLKQRQTTAINVLRGVFGTALSSMTNSAYDEAGVGAPDEHLIDSGKIIDTWALMGELADDLLNGAMLCHSNIRAALLEQDENDFERKSEGAFTIERYKGIPLFVSNSLVRPGTTDGYVYDTYFVTNGAIAWGEKPQVGDTLDVASMQYDIDRSKNNATVYDRTRFIMHVQGTAWGGSPSGQSATNAELATAGNWSLIFTSAPRCGVARILTNG